jgi:hypothetical protein
MGLALHFTLARSTISFLERGGIGGITYAQTYQGAGISYRTTEGAAPNCMLTASLTVTEKEPGAHSRTSDQLTQRGPYALGDLFIARVRAPTSVRSALVVGLVLASDTANGKIVFSSW